MATAKKTKKTITKKPQVKAVQKNTPKTARVVKTQDGTRLKKLTKKQAKKQEKSQQKQDKLPNAWRLLAQSLQQLWRNKKLFMGILLVYGLLYVLFVKGISANFQLENLRNSLQTTFEGKLSTFSSGVALYSLLLGSATSGTNQSGSIFQTFFVVIISLALIWALRQTYKGPKPIKIRESFYKSMYPLIPFVIVLAFILLQLMPALIVVSLFSIVSGNGLVVGAVQQTVSVLVLSLGVLWTLYMVSSSVFALYIVTLPDARPRASLKAAKKLVKFRRWVIIRKMAILPIALLLFSAVVLIPLIIVLPVAAEILFIFFTISLLAVLHSYFYTLYRSLL